MTKSDGIAIIALLRKSEESDESVFYAAFWLTSGPPFNGGELYSGILLARGQKVTKVTILLDSAIPSPSALSEFARPPEPTLYTGRSHAQ